MSAQKENSLSLSIYKTRKEMGKAAGQKAEAILLEALAKKKEARMIFAAAVSQDEILAYLAASKKIDWSRVIAFHMDEYIGLSEDAPQGFGNFLRGRIFDKVPFKKVYYINGQADPAEECKRYAALLAKAPIDLLQCGIGENGHIAFNDPGEAKFDDPVLIKVVNLDKVCRTQQVHDGAFKTLAQVPKTAFSITIPGLMNSAHAVCTVPGPSRAAAVKNALLGPVSEKCPASILRTHKDCSFFFDSESGKALL